MKSPRTSAPEKLGRAEASRRLGLTFPVLVRHPDKRPVFQSHPRARVMIALCNTSSRHRRYQVCRRFASWTSDRKVGLAPSAQRPALAAFTRYTDSHLALPWRRPVAVARTRRRPTSSSASRLCTECTRTRHSRTPSRSNRGTSHLQPSRSSQGRV